MWRSGSRRRSIRPGTGRSNTTARGFGFLAMAAADRGDKEAAIAALRRAVEAGYPAALVAAEPAFDSLRSDPRLRKLAGRG